MTRGSCRGVTLVELLVATALGIVVVGTVATLVAAGYVHGRVQPEANDAQQRLRAGVEALRSALAGAGAGLVVATGARGAGSGLPALLPQRFAVREPDAERAAFTDRLTVWNTLHLMTIQALGRLSLPRAFRLMYWRRQACF